MPVKELRYDKMVEDALRGVVRDALAVTATHGLYGDHHFYITFRTRHPNARVPDHVRARHPDEMTIVLQHQFWGLEVGEEAFEVTLSFNGVSERLRVPFSSVTGFADPSAKFGLQFQVVEEGDDDFEPVPEPEHAPASNADGEDEAPPAAPAASEDGKVVALDAFRKK